MIKAIFSLSLIISMHVKGAIPPKILKITLTEQELFIAGAHLENIEELSLADPDNKILKEYKVDVATSEKIVAKALDGSPIPRGKNLKLLINRDFYFPITESGRNNTEAVYITKKENAQNKIMVDEKSEINFSPGEDSEG